jgi:hypothetical protein
MFMMNTASHLFSTKQKLLEDGWSSRGNIFERDGDRYLPLYEAKMMHQFHHRYGDYAMRAEGSLDSELPRIPAATLDDPNYVVQPRYWVREWEVIKASSRVPPGLARAVEEKSEDRACQIIGLWMAGYAINRNLSEANEKVIVAEGRAHSLASMCKAVRDLDAAKKIEQQFPLADGEVRALFGLASFVEVAARLVSMRVPRWLLGFRDIARSTDERTALFSVLPPAGVGNKLPIVSLTNSPALFMANAAAYVFDYVVRQKLGGTTMNFFYVQQFAMLPPSAYTQGNHAFIRARVLELTYTARDICGFASDLGYTGAPFHWNPERRFLIRCELDALYFHLYGISREDACYILDTFPIVRRKDEAEHGEYRTQRLILELYDAMAEAERTGVPYQTRLDPPPADPRVAHAQTR